MQNFVGVFLHLLYNLPHPAAASCSSHGRRNSFGHIPATGHQGGHTPPRAWSCSWTHSQTSWGSAESFEGEIPIQTLRREVHIHFPNQGHFPWSRLNCKVHSDTSDPAAKYFMNMGRSISFLPVRCCPHSRTEEQGILADQNETWTGGFEGSWNGIREERQGIWRWGGQQRSSVKAECLLCYVLLLWLGD